MAASPWTFISLAICLLVSVSISSGNVVPMDGPAAHSRVARQIPADVQEKAEAAKSTFHGAAATGAQRAQDLANAARSHIAQRVRRSAGYYHGQAGERMGSRFHRDPFRYRSDRRDTIGVADDYRHDREERRRDREEEHEERQSEREERRDETEVRRRELEEREHADRRREEREREREIREREREREERRRERGPY